jgi:hypothetical protein
MRSRADIARDDGLQRHGYLRRDNDRVDARFRPGAMGADAGDVDIEEGAARHHGAGADGETADRQARPVMHAEDRFHRKVLEESFVDHRLRAAEALLGRLEDEVDAAVEISRLRQVARRSQQHGCMAVMAAGMHLAFMARAVVEVVGLDDRQRVHIGPQPDGLLAIADPKRADDAGGAEAAMNLHAEFFQLAGDDVGRAVFLEPEFRMRMDVAPPAGHVVPEGGNFVNNLHRPWTLPFRIKAPGRIMPGLPPNLLLEPRVEPVRQAHHRRPVLVAGAVGRGVHLVAGEDADLVRWHDVVTLAGG